MIQTFFVRGVGRGSDVTERSLEIAEVLRGGGNCAELRCIRCKKRVL